MAESKTISREMRALCSVLFFFIRRVREFPLSDIDGTEQVVEIVVLIQSISAAEALAEDGQIMLGEQTHRDDTVPVRQGREG